MKCPRCGHENVEGELFCAGCQQRLPRLSTEAYEAMYQTQDARWRTRRRRDVVHALAWGLALGLGTLAIAFLMESFDDPSFRGMIATGKQIWWLVGLLWGWVVWGLRRASSTER
jgi:hypothetical protein